MTWFYYTSRQVLFDTDVLNQDLRNDGLPLSSRFVL